MRKGKAITLLSIVSVIMTFILVMTFVRFSVGVKDYNSALGAIELDYDIAGGVAYTLTLDEDNEEEVTDINAVVETLEQRLEDLGYSTYVVKAMKSTDTQVLDYEIRIEIKNTNSASDDISAVAAYGKVKFYGGESQDATLPIMEDINAVEDSQYLGAVDGNHYISLVFTQAGQQALLTEMGSSSSYYLKITCGVDANGDEIALFNASLNKSDLESSRELSISGISSEETARQRALQIRKGGLAYMYKISDGVVINSPYGVDVGLKCTIAIITFVLIAIIAMCVLYRGLGIISALSTLLYIIFVPWLLIGVPGIVVNMGGIVGVICATLVCIYCMLTFSQRVKDEYANSKKTVKAAVNKGFKTSLVPTINIHVVCAVVALLLFALTKGVVKCFGITFGIGIGISLIATLLFTRMFTALILPLPTDKEKFLMFKRNDKENGGV